MLERPNTRMLMLVSTTARVGKTSIALNLAGRLAQRVTERVLAGAVPDDENVGHAIPPEFH